MSDNTVFNNIGFGIDASFPRSLTGDAVVFNNSTGKNIDATPACPVTENPQ